jgi:hypothetical protein
VIRLRQLNERVLEPLLDGSAAPQAVARGHWLCIGADLGRGAALTALGLGVVLLLPSALAAAWPLAMGPTVLILAAPAALPLGAMVRRWTRGAPARALLLAGLLGGALLGLLLGG